MPKSTQRSSTRQASHSDLSLLKAARNAVESKTAGNSTLTGIVLTVRHHDGSRQRISINLLRILMESLR